MSFVNLYVVGIYFRKPIPFVADGKGPTGQPTMSGLKILQAARTLGLQYQINAQAQLVRFGYTVNLPEDESHKEKFSDLPNGNFLVLGQALRSFPEPSLVLQYTSDPQPAKPVSDRPAFGTNGFYEGADIRIRLLTIYVK